MEEVVESGGVVDGGGGGIDSEKLECECQLECVVELELDLEFEVEEADENGIDPFQKAIRNRGKQSKQESCLSKSDAFTGSKREKGRKHDTTSSPGSTEVE